MKKKKPNIVFILNDHQAYYRHGWDGGVKPMTPNFDKLAGQGVEFTNAYSGTPLCGPVRRSLLSGLYPHTHKQYFNDSAVDYTEESYLSILEKDGYDNYYFGKWHAGPGTPITEHNCKGFSCEGYGNPYITQEYKDYLKKHDLPSAKHKIDYNFHPSNQTEFFEKLEEGVIYECEDTWCGEHAAGVTVTPKESHEAFFLANLACEELENLAKSDSDEPFHLRVDFWGPHQPFFPTQEYLDMYKPEDITLYGNHMDDLEGRAQVHKVDVNRGISNDKNELIIPSPINWSEWQKILARAYAHQTMVDDAGGTIIKKLKELGLDEDTIIIWSTDHGDGLASHGGHFDKCSYMSQEVMRIPMAVRWPNVIDSGQKNHNLVSNIDIPVSMLDSAGLSFSSKVHGFSFLDLAKNKDAVGRDGIFAETFGHGYVERLQGRMYVEGDYKLVKFENQIDEMYNLQEDPFELRNLALEPEFDGIKERMCAGLKRKQVEFDDLNFPG